MQPNLTRNDGAMARISTDISVASKRDHPREMSTNFENSYDVLHVGRCIFAIGAFRAKIRRDGADFDGFAFAVVFRDSLGVPDLPRGGAATARF